MARKKKRRALPGDGSFRVIPSGKVEYRIVYMDMFGQKKRKSFTGVDEDDCLMKAEKFYEELSKKSQGINLDATVIEILEEKYQQDFKMNFVGESGYWRNMRTLDMMRKRGIGNMPIRDIQKYHIMSYLSDITRYSNSVISKTFQQLKLAFSIAWDKEIITKNLMLSQDIRCPKSAKPDKKVRGFSKEEQKKLEETLESWKGKWGANSYRLQVLIELYTGMRMGEINALKPEDLDFEKKLIHVRRTVSRGIESRSYLKEGAKTDAGSRTIPMNSKAEELFRQALEKMQKNKLGLIFFDHNKKDIITTNQVNCFFKRLCDKAEVEYSGQHALRHTFATRCIESGVPAVVLKTWMGHTDIHITLDTYTDVFDRMNDNAVGMFEEYMEEM